MIEELIENLENDEDAVLMHPVTSQSLASTQGSLIKNGGNKLPDDYIEFLHITNGLIFRRNFFYGTNAIEEERLPDIVSANNDFSEEYEADEYLVIGNDRYSFFVYNLETKMYEVVEKEDLEMIEEFEDFSELLMEFCDGENSSYHDDEDDFMFEDDYED